MNRNWYSIAYRTLRAWPVAAGLCFFEFMRRAMQMPWYTVPATLGAIAALCYIVIGYALLEDWLKWKADEWTPPKGESE